MRYINNLSIKLTVILVFASLARVTGQPVTNAFYCSRELSHLQMVFNDTAHVSFQAEYVISFNDATKDTVRYQYKVSKYKVHRASSDSNCIIQNNMYNLALNHNWHRAVVSRPVDVFTYVLQVKVTDLSFYQTLVTGRAVADTGSYKKLSYFFKAASPYRSYDIIYDPVTYRIHAIQYSFNMAGSGSSPVNSKMPFQVTILFSNYQTGQFTDQVFSTSAYFMRKQGVCHMVAPYTSYQLINSLNQ